MHTLIHPTKVRVLWAITELFGVPITTIASDLAVESRTLRRIENGYTPEPKVIKQLAEYLETLTGRSAQASAPRKRLSPIERKWRFATFAMIRKIILNAKLQAMIIHMMPTSRVKIISALNKHYNLEDINDALSTLTLSTTIDSADVEVTTHTPLPTPATPRSGRGQQCHRWLKGLLKQPRSASFIRNEASLAGFSMTLVCRTRDDLNIIVTRGFRTSEWSLPPVDTESNPA
jgi:hypothetical protein